MNIFEVKIILPLLLIFLSLFSLIKLKIFHNKLGTRIIANKFSLFEKKDLLFVVVIIFILFSKILSILFLIAIVLAFVNSKLFLKFNGLYDNGIIFFRGIIPWSKIYSLDKIDNTRVEIRLKSGKAMDYITEFDSDMVIKGFEDYGTR